MSNDTGVKFSIIVPTYNRAKLIQPTLSSVLEQTYRNYEVIVVDNCSTDNTEEVLRPLVESEQIRFIRHDKNYERSKSRNTGMAAATGDFVTFLDSDDFMYPNNLAAAAEYVQQHPQIKFFHNLYELIDENKSVIRKYPFPSLDNQLAAIVSGNFMSCIGNFIHRDIYQKYRFDTHADLVGAEDWEFWMRVMAKYPLGRIEQVNSGILHHDNRTVQTQSISKLEAGNQYLVGKFRQDPELAVVYAPYLNRIHANSYMYLATLANGGKLYDDARGYLKKAIQKDIRVVATERFARTLRRTLLHL